MDQNTGGTVYNADFKIRGVDATFSAEPVNGLVPHEWVALSGTPDKRIGKLPMLSLWKEVLAKVYGNAVATDFQNAMRLNAKIAIWKGKMYAYARSSDAFVVFRLSDLPAVLKNANECAAFDCAGD